MLELLHKPLYHGSVWSFKRVDVSKGRPYKDFGKGFYMSVDRAQAIGMMHKKYDEIVERSSDELPRDLVKSLYRIELGRGENEIVKFGNVTRVLGGRSDNVAFPKNVYYVFAEDLSGDKVRLSRNLVDAVKAYVQENAGKIDKFFHSTTGDASARR